MVKESGEPEPPLSEHQFIDVVSKNLRSGRCLLLIVGDGIHEEAETMAEFLQQNAGAHFALAMVTLGVYELPSTGGRLLISVGFASDDHDRSGHRSLPGWSSLNRSRACDADI